MFEPVTDYTVRVRYKLYWFFKLLPRFTDNSSPHIHYKISADTRHTFPNVPHTPSTRTRDSARFAVSDTGLYTFDKQPLAPDSTRLRAIRECHLWTFATTAGTDPHRTGAKTSSLLSRHSCDYWMTATFLGSEWYPTNQNKYEHHKSITFFVRCSTTTSHVDFVVVTSLLLFQLLPSM